MSGPPVRDVSAVKEDVRGSGWCRHAEKWKAVLLIYDKNGRREQGANETVSEMHSQS